MKHIKPLKIAIMAFTTIAYIFTSDITASAQSKDELTVQKGYEIAGMNEGMNSYSEEDIEILAKLLDVEAGSDVVEGKIGIAQVVKNRLDSDIFPDSVLGVVTQKNQFADYTNGSVQKENYEIARIVLTSSTSVFSNNILFFRNPDKCKNATRGKDWSDRKYELTLGLHDFYSYLPT